MKILMPATHYWPVVGGIETWTRQISERLSREAEIFVVTGKVKNQPKEEVLNGVRIWRTSPFTLSNLSASPLFYTLSLLPYVFFKSLSLIRKEKIEILHCQGFLSSCLGFLFNKLTGVPFITTVQRLESKKNPLKNFIYRQAAVCIGASRAVADYFKGIGCRNVEIIPNGIDLQRFGSIEKKPHEGFVVMTVARLEKVKGIEYLIRAVKLIEVDPRLISLVIVGDGSERKNLEDLAGNLNLQDRISFLGEIPNEKIPGLLAGADCFVLPSLREGFGIAILEAQAAGIPVIGSRIGGILDLIEDRKTGLLVEPGNSQELADAIHEVYSGLEFGQVNLEKYDWQKIAQKVYEIYHRLRHLSA